MLGQVPKSPYALSEEIQKEEALKHVRLNVAASMLNLQG